MTVPVEISGLSNAELQRSQPTAETRASRLVRRTIKLDFYCREQQAHASGSVTPPGIHHSRHAAT
jgi:hypothetical protein